jgi:zona occludens toxin
MSILISAPIRTGKTLFVVQEIFKYLNQGRMVYTNIVGIKIDGVISVSSTMYYPFDWRDLPNGSVCIWDEAHEHPAFSEKDLLKDYKIDTTYEDEIIDRIMQLTDISVTEKKHRVEKIEKQKRDRLAKRKQEIRDIGEYTLMSGHHGIELVLITQRPAKLNPDVLASVTTHFVMRRKFGMDAAIIWELGEAMTTWSKSTAEIALNKRLWRYPKHLYGFYTSSESHQVRKSFPAKYYAIGLIPVALLGFAFLKASQTGFFGFFGKEEKQQVATVQPVQQPEKANTQQVQKPNELVCTYQNIHTPECQQLQQKKNLELNQQIQSQPSVIYSVNDPYNSQYQSMITLQASDFPRLSGCVKYNGKYHAIDQQGNKMKDVSQDACKRWIDKSERPFDPFAANSSNYQQNENRNKESSNLNLNTNNIQNISTQALGM